MTMKKLKMFSVLFLLTQTLFAQSSTETDSAFIRDNYTKREVYITMRDGIRLFTAIYSPKDVSKKYPMLLKRTPYTVAPYGENEYTKSFQNRTLAQQGTPERDAHDLRRARGNGENRGRGEDVRRRLKAIIVVRLRPGDQLCLHHR